MRTTFFASLLSALTLVFASNAMAMNQSDLDRALYPHATAVKEAMKKTALVAAPAPVAAPIQMADAGTESAMCRALRREVARASSEPSGQNAFPTFDAKGRSMMGRGLNFGYSERAKAESRYLSHCE